MFFESRAYFLFIFLSTATGRRATTHKQQKNKKPQEKRRRIFDFYRSYKQAEGKPGAQFYSTATRKVVTPGAAGRVDDAPFWIDAKTCVSVVEEAHASWIKLVCGGYCSKADKKASCGDLWYGKDACAKAG